MRFAQPASSGASNNSGGAGFPPVAEGAHMAKRESGKPGGKHDRGGAESRSYSSKITFDPEVIRKWAEERSAKPACVRGTGGEKDIGMLRLDFPGYTGEESLQPISWDDWFRKFEERQLALVYQDQTATGEKSNFNKIISRETAEETLKKRHA
jgi:hypothetical protein